ncbi:TetR/AcrR family transcriptional regulator [Actinoplanes sp. KI2]|uniref:TetR/AcrR family transcriptional regulator n=1 Tax=Actinoplanes sp. KI2 TaxID=2983315 RepID=UPI0021D5A8C2|nr:TetR/AcrR family transcriptional regulator [Actinoplanes sp. KI2]MCU7724235.1 TetR/AcrR family transcriptional regulator [Actinoplanes sp. KI2]
MSSQGGRPRDPALEAAILDATQDLLIQHGFAATTVEAVARAAGTGKAAVYRRWPSKIGLVIAAVQALQSPPAVPDTGTLRGDLLECAMHFVQPHRRPAMVLAGVLDEIGRNDELREAAYAAIGKPPAMAFAAVLRRWQARGEVASSAPADLLAGIVPAAAFRNVVFRRRALDHRTAVDLVDFVLLPALRPTS